MRQEPLSPDVAPDDLEERMTYMVQKLIILWRADHENAYGWLMKRKRVVRLFLLAVLLESVRDEQSTPTLKADCSEIIAYVKNKAA